MGRCCWERSEQAKARHHLTAKALQGSSLIHFFDGPILELKETGRDADNRWDNLENKHSNTMARFTKVGHANVLKAGKFLTSPVNYRRLMTVQKRTIL